MKKIILFLSILFLYQITFAQWKQLNGPLAGYVTCLLNNNGLFYAGTPNSVFVSSDRGATWAKKDKGLADWASDIHDITAVGNKIFVATDDGVFMTTNGGDSWTASHSTPALFNTVNSLCFDGSKLYEGTYDSGIFVSPDTGKTWNWLGQNLPITYVPKVYSSGDKIFAITSTKGFYISTDNGQTWVASDTPFSLVTVNTITSHNGKLYAGTSAGTYISMDDGVSWQGNSGSPGGGIYLFSGNYIFANGYRNALGISPNNGTTWEKAPAPGESALLLVGDTLFTAGDYGIYWSSDTAATWHLSNTGLCTATVYSVTVSGNNILALLDSSILISSDDGNSWQKTAGNGLPSGIPIQTLAAKGNELFAGTFENGMYVSTDNGDLWTPVNNGIASLTTIQTIGIQGNNIYISGSYINTPEAYISSDDGASWKLINNNLPSEYYTITEFAFAGDTVYASTLFTVYYSIDSGAHWLNINSLPFDNYAGVVVSNGTVAVGAGNSIYYSRDGGATWNLSDGSNTFNRSGIAILAALNDTMYAGDGYGGLYMSTDTARTWFATGPLNLSVYSFATGNGYIYMGGLYSGVWKHTSTPSILTDIKEIKKSNGFTLYPNPAENIITVNTGSNATQQIVSVYNTLGKSVMEQRNNLSIFNLDVSSLPSGIFLIKVKGDSGMSKVERFVKQ